MADAETARLCVQIIHSHFGPTSSAVSCVLLTRGRLPLNQLVRFTAAKPRVVRASVLVLVQHNILWHDRSEDEGEVLEFNIDECLMRLRFGRFVWQAGELFGGQASEIVQLVLDHGKLRPPDIISHLSSRSRKGSTVYSQTLYKLVATHYLKPSTILSHISPRDKLIKYDAEEKLKISGFPTAKQLRQAKETAEVRLKREEREAEAVGLRRKEKDPPIRRLGKRKAVDEDVVDDSVYFRLNFDKFNIHIRNKLIETAAGERYNKSAALVMRALLKATEAHQKTVADIRTDPISVASLASQISDDDLLTSGLVLQVSKASSTVVILKQYLGMLASSDNPTPAGRASSFISLGSSKIQVEFEIVGRRLRRRVLEAVTRERHGDDGVRILRLLLSSGMMDEKQISKTAMMAAKEVRPLLAALSSDSLISIQEVPKSADRNPTRTFYLWHVDLRKSYSALLGNLYKTLYNIGMRRQAEEADPGLKAVLEKQERSDVREDETLLTRMERDLLQDWKRKQEKFAILEMRVEEAVFILRDLGPLGIGDE